jgi:hypothetical protein
MPFVSGTDYCVRYTLAGMYLMKRVVSRLSRHCFRNLIQNVKDRGIQLLNIREAFRQSVSSIAVHKLRSFLTRFGIIWGITSGSLLVQGRGCGRDQNERLKTIGVDLAIVWGGRTSEQAGGYAPERLVRFSIQDAYTIKSEAYLIKTVSP